MEVITTQLPFLGVASSLIGGRVENQDSYMAAETPDGYLAVVCDGMGGGPGGKTASAIAATTIVDFILNRCDKVEGATSAKDYGELLTMAVKAANTALRNKIREVPELEGMGTTCTVVLASPQCATMAHVGDSRIYQLRKNKIIFRTTDHSKVAEMVTMGALTEEQARLSAFSNIITRALGIGDSVDVDIDVRPYEKGDRFVLCTDGIWGSMPQPELVKNFTRGPKSLQGTVDNLNVLVENIGKEKGGHHDNYTILIFETKKDSIMKEPISRKTRLLLFGLGGVCAASILLNIIFFCLPSKGDVTKELRDTQEELRKKEQVIDSMKNIIRLSGKVSKIDENLIVKNNTETVSKQEKEEKDDKSEVKKPENVKSEAQASSNIEELNAEERVHELISKLDELKRDIVSVGNRSMATEKKDEIIKIINKFNQLNNNYNDVLTRDNVSFIKNNIIGELKKPVTTDTSKSKSQGQCNAIAAYVDELIKQLQ